MIYKGFVQAQQADIILVVVLFIKTLSILKYMHIYIYIFIQALSKVYLINLRKRQKTIG